MNPSFQASGKGVHDLQLLWEDSGHAFCRRVSHADHSTALVAGPVAEHPSPVSLGRLAHEFALRDELDPAWAVRPVALVQESGRTLLVLEDPGGEPLVRRLGSPLDLAQALQLAIAAAAALGKAHQRGLIHKDIKPAHFMVGCADGAVRLTGFGIASRLPREHQTPEPPETIAGTLAYMAPEQSGRMNRSVDARSDLYALGVTLYQMLTGVLPFTASDPMEWVHCHIARQPIAPNDRVEHVPVPVSAIIMKLLAKMPEERYQTAGGLERDLRRCLAEWQAHGRIDSFPLGLQDTPDRLLIPERLYGRRAEIATLTAAFDRVVAGGKPELVLVSGYSGIGKSAVVNELHRVLVPPRGLFAAGKFDQHRRDIPYATVAQAFQGLVRQILSKSDAELAGWRQALLEALGPNGQLMVNLVPELALIIGDQPPAPDLPPRDAHNHFQMVFRRFVGVFARQEHPLALFLDDLQWLDSATLELIDHLVTHPEVSHLLLIGAYRDNEVGPTHPLTRTLTAIRGAGASVQAIVLAPLMPDDVAQLLAEALHMERERTRPLAALVFEKTGGNPFFTIQFISALTDEGLLTFESDAAAWTWDLERIHAKGYTDNVVDLVVGKLSRFPLMTRKILGQLGCLGNAAKEATLILVHGESEETLHRALWDAVRTGLVLRSEGTYTFLHDRVQEAAYGLIPEGERPAAHLRIARLLSEWIPAEEIDENIFDIVNQFDRGSELIDTPEEREQVAAFNLLAGKRAKASTAYAAALQYFTAGRALLGDDAWVRHYRLAFDLERHRAECEFMAGAFGSAEERLEAISAYAATPIDKSDIVCLSMLLYFTTGRSERAVDTGLAYLQRVGIMWSAHPEEASVRREFQRLRRNLARRPLASLSDLPTMTDPGIVAMMDVLTGLFPAAHYVDRCLLELVLLRMTNLSLENGNCDSSSVAYSALNMVLGPRFADYRTAYDFGQLACELVDRRGMNRYKARVYSCVGSFAMPWTKPLSTCWPLMRLAFTFGTSIGDMAFAAYTLRHLITNLLASGMRLPDVQQEAETALDYARTAGIGLPAEKFVGQLRLIRMLRGMEAPEPDDGWAREDVEHLPGLAMIVGFHWVFRLQECYHAGDIEGALDAAARAAPIRWAMRSCFEEAEYELYAALTRAAACEGASPEQRKIHLQALRGNLACIQAWGKNCPETFGHRVALIRAELMRLCNREMTAERLYEEAIRRARENDFVQNEALAYELAGRFYAARGFEQIATLYLHNARACYLRWGADGKVRQLDAAYPHLRADEPAPITTIAAPVEHLDLATVIKVSQAVSGEIEQDRLLETLMRTALEQAGAERGTLVLLQAGEQRIAAQAETRGDNVDIILRDEPVSSTRLPVSVLNYAMRTQESVILDDAIDSAFSADAYILQQQARSVLCLPLLNQTRVIGVLCLENNLAPRVFAPARLSVLKLLASQAAVSLENTRLYRDLAERESRIRRLVDSNVIGIVIWDIDGRLLDANDAFLNMVQYTREDLDAGLRWYEMTPPEWQEAHVLEEAEELQTTGMMQTREKEYFRKDGSRVPVLIGAAAFDGQPNQGVAYILDLTRLKQVEAEARESERRYREVQMELAHSNRVTTMGQLTGSIAHEVNQPIAATVVSAQAALRWLEHEPPDLVETRQLLAQIVQNGTRAGDVIHRIRALIKKAPPQLDVLEINGPIREVIELTRNESMKNHVSVVAELTDGLPRIRGDRVQLQQVVLNLIINAIEAMSGASGGKRNILIRTERAGSGDVLVVVRDSGPGLAPESVERVFETFYTTKSSGMGMGLPICRSIIEAHGGQIWASANVSRGATFQFALPPWNETISIEKR